LFSAREFATLFPKITIEWCPDETRRTRSRQDDAFWTRKSQRRFVVSSAWLTLFFAGLLEVCWAIGLKYTVGFTRLAPSLFTVTTLAGSMYLLAKAARTLPIGTAYAVWVGIGAVGAGILGIALFKEPVTLARIGFMTMLVVSIIGLKATSS